MKNLTFLAGLVFLSGLTGASAAPYIGLDGNFGSLALTASDPVLYQQSASGTSFHLGDRFGHFAGEIGYGSSSATGGVNGDGMHLDQATVDGIFYVPILGNFNVLLTGGGAETNYGISSFAKSTYTGSDGKVKTSNADVPLLHGDEFDWRAGMGLSFAYANQFEIYAIGRYQPLTMGGSSQNLLSLTVGVDFYL